MNDWQKPGEDTIDSAAWAVLELARSVLGDLDGERVLERVLESARELTGARYAAIGVLDESRTRLARFITAGVDESARRRIGSPPTGLGVLGELIRNPVPLRLANVGRHPRSYGFPAGHPPMESFLGVPVMVAGEPFGSLYLTEKPGGGKFTELDEQALVGLSELAGVAIDHARRFSGSEARRDELQRDVDALGAMVEISRALAGQTDVARILGLVAKRGRALVSARALIIELQIDRELEVAAAAGEVPEGLVGTRMPFEGSAADAALRSNSTQRLADQLTKARLSEHGLGRFGFAAECGLIVPLVFNGRSVGVLVALDRLDRGPQFSAQDERLLEAFATSAGAAVATAQSAATEQRRQRLAVAEAERARWARELHDQTLQGMAAVRLGLLAGRRAGGPGAWEEAVSAAIGQLESEMAGLRGLISDLRPPTLDQLGAKAAIEALAEGAGESGLNVDVYVDLAYESGRLSQRATPELEITMFRIVQEALTNAIKNGRAAHAVVEVIESETTIGVTIRDDGAGFDPADRTEGFGVLGMRERVELLGGTLEIESAPGQGTTIRATLPIQRQAQAQTPETPPAEDERTG
jgi:signal transduction histidine kinase